jgi:Ca2+-transporting ATPase
MRTVETLGSATVICVDKKGTITENFMALKEIFTLHKAYEQSANDKRPYYHMTHEYPLGGTPPMMTHVFEDKDGNRIIAAKGAAEAIIKCCTFKNNEEKSIVNAMLEMGTKGYRVLAVVQSDFKGKVFPPDQQKLSFSFVGLVAFYDPPKQNIAKVLQDFYKAGISVKLITGDNAITTKAIAKQIGFVGYQHSISGEELLTLDDSQLQKTVRETNIFTRMFPLAKLRIINALKANGEIVAMTGDGVNDGPALKAAHIGIAMGKKGTEIAKQAAALILVADDLSKMVYAIAMGRRIYVNLKKAIQYIISIHIPIILVVLIPLILNWSFPNILLPMHVIILELIMGPTCSIIFENEPNEKNAMKQKPRPFTQTFFNKRELGTSIIQGLMIAIGSFVVYQYAVTNQYNEELTRTMVFTTLITANIMLTLSNRSFYFSILTTLSYRNRLMPIAMVLTILITALLFYLKPVAAFFGFLPLDAPKLLVNIGLGVLSVIWFEGLKWYNRLAKKKSDHFV